MKHCETLPKILIFSFFKVVLAKMKENRLKDAYPMNSERFSNNDVSCVPSFSRIIIICAFKFEREEERKFGKQK